MADPLSLDEALAEVLARARPLETERVPIGDAAGRVLAERARAEVALPPFPSSAMDGYAVRSTDTPGHLPIVFRIAAGRPSAQTLGPGQAMGIATGGVVPDGSDAVIQHELVVERDNVIEISDRVPPGTNIRPRGGDLEAGDTILEHGTRLGSAGLGALAAAGVAEVVCHRRPRCAVLSTGTELRAPGEPLGPGEVYEANGLMLESELRMGGAQVERSNAIVDDETEHRAALEQGLGADVLVTSGGVSVGPHDLVRRVAAELGVEEVFWGVSVKPGKPVAFGVRGSTLVFGLPGNPVSSLVTCRVLVLPAVLALQGLADPQPRYEPGSLALPVQPDARRLEFVRARIVASEESIVLEPLAGRESHMIARAAQADALVLIPPGDKELSAGETVRFLRL